MSTVQINNATLHQLVIAISKDASGSITTMQHYRDVQPGKSYFSHLLRLEPCSLAIRSSALHHLVYI